MSKNTLGILFGGIMPALLLGLFSMFQKIGTRHGVGPEVYIFLGGITIGLVGVALIFVTKTGEFTLKGTVWALLSGACWAVATACVSYALFYYNTPMSKLAPIFNTNTLTTVILSMLLFGEWKELNVVKVFSGAVMIIVGAIIVSQA